MKNIVILNLLKYCKKGVQFIDFLKYVRHKTKSPNYPSRPFPALSMRDGKTEKYYRVKITSDRMTTPHNDDHDNPNDAPFS